MTFLEPVM